MSVDLSQITEAGKHELSYTVRFPANVSASDLKIDSRSPVTVSVEVERYIRRAVEVRTVFEGEAAADEDELLVIDNGAMELHPAEIMVTGPAELVKNVAYARVVIQKGEITETVDADYEYDLIDTAGEVINRTELVTDAEKVNVLIPVHKTRQVPLRLELVPGGGATLRDVEYTIRPEFITISGEPEQVDGIREIQLDPANLGSIIAQEATVTRQIVLPEGLTAASLGESVQINLRGTDADLKKLRQRVEEIVVTVDLSGYSQGTFIVPVKVQLPTDLQVGAVGSNTITVTLS